MRSDLAPWVIVAGGFHQRGGMDRANAALAGYLLHSGVPLHLVAHEIDEPFAGHPDVTAHVVPRPRGMPALAERLLSLSGFRVASRVTRDAPGARVVVNGGNCPWPDVNWVHAVHAVWPVHDAGAPWWTRGRSRRLKQIARVRERAALARARIVVANSHATRRALIEALRVPGERIRTVYPGSDPAWGPPDRAERLSARLALGLARDVPVVAFVGALGADTNKGFDRVWEAWQDVHASGTWDAQLVVAGSGWRLRRWQHQAAASGCAGSIRFLGFTSRIREVLAAADLLVSPVRYEAYGLNVHEALCRGLPVMVTRTAGVTERFDASMWDALLPAQVTSAVLAERLRAWRRDMDGWRARAASTACRLRACSWDDMAAELVRTVHQPPRRIPA